MATEREIMNTYIPDSIKTLIRTGQMDKVASIMTGLDEFTIEKIAGYMGGRMAARKLRWQPVFDGLTALRNLKG